jgi:hypothetical protein
MVQMTEREGVSRRRMFSFLGMAAAIGVGLPILTPMDAEAQTIGMERRQDRRMNRVERRYHRRANRYDRRAYRRGY